MNYYMAENDQNQPKLLGTASHSRLRASISVFRGLSDFKQHGTREDAQAAMDGLALIGLKLYIIFFSPGIGTVPWIVNSEMYPLRHRGVCGGIAATANWISNFIVAQSFLSLTQAIGTSWTFLIFRVISVVALLFVLVCVPETKGLPIEEIEKMLESRALELEFWKLDEPKKYQDV